MTSFFQGIRPATARLRTDSSLDAVSRLRIDAFKLVLAVAVVVVVVVAPPPTATSFVVSTTPRGDTNADVVASCSTIGMTRIDIQFRTMVGVA
jgi:hypothetical protein